MKHTDSNESAQSGQSYTTPLISLTFLFFMWGFITCMNDILIPHLKGLFVLSYLEAMLVQFCFFGAYFTGSLIYFLISYFKGDPINKIGYKNGLLLGLIISALGCLMFYPAATLSVYGLFLAAFFVLGLGFTLLQITANPYVSLLGKESTASGRLNLVQAFNSFGTTIAPILGGYLIFHFFATEGTLSAEATKMPYLIFFGVFVLLTFFIYKVKLPAFKGHESELDGLGALRFPQLKRGAFAIFFYVGAEVTIGSFMISFLEHGDITGMKETVAKNFLSLYWGGAMIGRFLGAISMSDALSQGKKMLYMVLVCVGLFVLIYAIVDLSFEQMQWFLLFIAANLIGFTIGKSSPALMLSLFATVNIVLLLVTVMTGGALSMWCLVGVGLFNSIMWSNIFTLSISGLGEYKSQGSSLLVMAILGGAVIPPLQGSLADTVGIQLSFLIPVVCYVYITYFGLFCMKKFKSVEFELEKATTSGH
ncbi:sugar MFS transporter [Pedobacter nyackensis]|uniref:MFS transporter, FHS family, L-fucose permease n=1 Tax=Pedobacter nyackensis TaxID=475255 RepID=A0A1W2EQA4_9SPHI|nr:sugar MFS transporter [Pedobacter nyackensis]SMD11308.1 MFS transporter, FHS family, L-fucose permease [Pedobacter nyackensis]